MADTHQALFPIQTQGLGTMPKKVLAGARRLLAHSHWEVRWQQSSCWVGPRARERQCHAGKQPGACRVSRLTQVLTVRSSQLCHAERQSKSLMYPNTHHSMPRLHTGLLCQHYKTSIDTTSIDAVRRDPCGTIFTQPGH